MLVVWLVASDSILLVATHMALSAASSVDMDSFVVVTSFPSLPVALPHSAAIAALFVAVMSDAHARALALFESVVAALLYVLVRAVLAVLLALLWLVLAVLLAFV